jgi:hypothetical protein
MDDRDFGGTILVGGMRMSSVIHLGYLSTIGVYLCASVANFCHRCTRMNGDAVVRFVD